MRLALLLAGALLAAPVIAADVLPCEPSASCALRMARDAAQFQVLNAPKDRARTQALDLLLWAAREDKVTTPETLRPFYVALRARLDKLPAGAVRTQSLATLARAMAASGLVPEARLLSNAFTTQEQRDGVHAEVARFHASREKPREAFEALSAIPADTMARALARSQVLNALIDTGKPEVVREAGKYADVKEPGLAESMVPLALQAAGQHEAARAETLKIADANTRVALLGMLQERNEQWGYDAELLPTAKLLYDEARKFKDPPGQPELAARLRVEAADKLIGAMFGHDNAGALTLMSELPAEERAEELALLLPRLENPADVRTAARLVKALPADVRALAEDGLAVARVRIGEINAEESLRSAHESTAMTDALIQLAFELGSAQKEKTQAILNAAMKSAREDGMGRHWGGIVSALLNAGLLAEAEKVINDDLEDPGSRADARLELSAAQAKAGLKPQAAASQARALREFESSGYLVKRPDTLAGSYADAGMLGNADAELRRLYTQDFEPRALQFASQKLLFAYLRAKDLPHAFRFAAAWARFLGNSPDPFATIYSELTRKPGPTSSLGDFSGEIRADPGLLPEDE